MIDKVLPMRTKAFNASKASFSEPAGPGTLKMSPSSARMLKNMVDFSPGHFKPLLIRFDVNPGSGCNINTFGPRLPSTHRRSQNE